MNRIMLKGKVKVLPGILDTIEIEFREPYGKGKIHYMKDRVVVTYDGVMGNEMKKILERCAALSISDEKKEKKRVL
ncbi:hypothetical protein [Stygiolobus caldivivus]|uniref:Uncharacterized protein n=1 Tax=Stygiolobus caldivivus TaxID=2824673 RepID=A0A8D5U6B3_9CREN|nr:hypothetical protein [Stygiolobus caldivivus]BCU69636.1 hypothetical protein KN1_09330 [Stygiolobus caldivivus]